MKELATPFSILILAVTIAWAAYIIKPTRPGDCTNTDRKIVDAIMYKEMKYSPIGASAETLKHVREQRKNAKGRLIEMGYGGCFGE